MHKKLSKLALPLIALGILATTLVLAHAPNAMAAVTITGQYDDSGNPPPANTADSNSGCQEGGTGQYCLLEPLPLGSNSVYDKYDPATTSAATYINIIIKVFISIIGVLGVIMIILGGVQYMSTDAVSKKEGGKEMITNSVFGLLLALASWVILNTINPHLTDVTIDPAAQCANTPADQQSATCKGITVSGPDAPPSATTNTTVTISGTKRNIASHCSDASVQEAAKDGVPLTDGVAWDSVTAIHANDDQYRSSLKTGGIDVNAPNCSTATLNKPGCTSVYKLGDSTVTHLKQLRSNVCGSNSSCKLVLTGGTECWLHTTHQIGSGAVDLQATPELNTYITGNAAFPNDGQYHSKDGFSFLAEVAGQTVNTTGAHWHVNLK